MIDNIYNKALELGFSECGFAKIDNINNDFIALQDWLSNGYAGNMSYLHNYLEMRQEPSKLLDSSKYIIVVLMNYFPKERQPILQPQIAPYAYGNDYHYIIKSRLNKIITLIESYYPDCKNLACCDTAPLLERTWAVRAGLGWIGKNSMLINHKLGSYTFIGSILTSADLTIKKNNILTRFHGCGDCTKCVDACPVKAILPNGTIDARKCISYNTIENREDIDPKLEQLFGNRLYGCDECLKACPHNSKAKPHNIPELMPIEGLFDLNWDDFTRSTFKHMFKHSAMQRAGYKKLRNRLQTIAE